MSPWQGRSPRGTSTTRWVPHPPTVYRFPPPLSGISGPIPRRRCPTEEGAGGCRGGGAAPGTPVGVGLELQRLLMGHLCFPSGDPGDGSRLHEDPRELTDATHGAEARVGQHLQAEAGLLLSIGETRPLVSRGALSDCHASLLLEPHALAGKHRVPCSRRPLGPHSAARHRPVCSSPRPPFFLISEYPSNKLRALAGLLLCPEIGGVTASSCVRHAAAG